MVYLAAVALFASGLMASVQAANLQHHEHVHKNHLHRKALSPPTYGPPPPETPAGPAQYPPVPPKHDEPHTPIASAPKPNATECGCTTYTTYWYGTPTMVPILTSSSSSTSKTSSSTTKTSSSTTKTTSSTSKTTSSTSKTTSSTSKTSSSASKTSSTTTSTPKPSTPAAPPKPAPPAQSPPPKDAVKPPPPPPAPSKPPAKPEEAPSPPPKPAPQPETPKSPVSPPGAPTGDKWAMTYTPYRADGGCKSADEVSNDINSIKSKGFSTVRIYATDCQGAENVGAACKAIGMKMILGIFIDGKGMGAAHDQLNHLAQWGPNGNWGMVEMVVAGNEAIFGGFTTAPEMANFIMEAKSVLQAAGYNGPVTTTEPLNVIQQYASTLCPVVDVIGANLHPFFNGQVSASGAGDLVAQQLQDLSACCGGKLEAYNLETGWPSNGQANGAAVPGAAEQKQAIDSIVAKVGSKSAIFSFEDDTWKAPGAYNIEQFWGCAKLFG